jgi:hypothetical protein
VQSRVVDDYRSQERQLFESVHSYGITG